jgi:hypothetical protein
LEARRADGSLQRHSGEEVWPHEMKLGQREGREGHVWKDIRRHIFSLKWLEYNKLLCISCPLTLAILRDPLLYIGLNWILNAFLAKKYYSGRLHGEPAYHL